MKIRALLGVCILGMSQLAMAEMPPKPESCPATSALSSQPFFMAQQPENAPGYVAISMGKYSTNDNWGFVMGFIEAENMLGALLEANKNLTNIVGQPEPMPVPDQDMWVCVYGVKGTPYQAAAVTPLGMPGQAASLLTRIG